MTTYIFGATPGHAQQRVVGTHFRQDNIGSVTDATRVYATLEAEPTNEADPNAIKVMLHATDHAIVQAGYIPQTETDFYRPQFHKDDPLIFRAIINRGDEFWVRLEEIES